MKKLTTLFTIFVFASCSRELNYNCNLVDDVVISKDRTSLTVSNSYAPQKTLYICDKGEFTNLYGCGTENTFMFFRNSKNLTSAKTVPNPRDFSAHECVKR